MTRMIYRIVIISTLLLLALTACGAGAAKKLVETSWVVDTLDQAPPVEGSELTLVFEEEKLGGSSGCNSYGGSYKAKGGTISISELFSTEMACMEPQGIMEQEQRYLSLLGEAQSFEINGDVLVIKTSAGSQVTLHRSE